MENFWIWLILIIVIILVIVAICYYNKNTKTITYAFSNDLPVGAPLKIVGSKSGKVYYDALLQPQQTFKMNKPCEPLNIDFINPESTDFSYKITNTTFTNSVVLYLNTDFKSTYYANTQTSTAIVGKYNTLIYKNETADTVDVFAKLGILTMKEPKILANSTTTITSATSPIIFEYINGGTSISNGYINIPINYCVQKSATTQTCTITSTNVFMFAPDKTTATFTITGASPNYVLSLASS